MTSQAPIVIGIAGKMGSGKTLVSTIIAGYPETSHVAYISFADPIKRMICALCDHTSRDKDIIEFTGHTYGQLLQLVGEGMKAIITPDIWIQAARQKYENLIKGAPDIIVFTDVRFESESKFIASIGGTVLLLERDVRPDSNHIGARDTNHASEKLALVNSPHIWRLTNNGMDEDVLEAQVFAILDDIIEARKNL